MSYDSKIRQNIISNPITSMAELSSCNDVCMRNCGVGCSGRCGGSCDDTCNYDCGGGCSDECGHTCAGSCARECAHGSGMSANNSLL
ncbi:hypothetical protein KQI41_14270 [Tissierella pigra]|uniref:Uncharacterized protein n=1 Tax=Tissierella pigra TaxID=2607614 RepID=A0A6N7XE26_9FIRM|nr:hypothetical protein [Tissierella pigra]MBU5427550.1 hypothetical protein [Tissierella pigra]MSU00299.1 hypothetical protein [Tissierella pigra]